MSTISPEYWQAIEGCLSVLTADSDQFDSELDALIADLDHVRFELGEKAVTLGQQQQELVEKQRALHDEHQDRSTAARQLEQQEVRLLEALAELDDTRSQLIAQEEAAIGDADERTQAVLEQIQKERDALRTELDSSRQEMAEIAELLDSQEQVSAATCEENQRLTQELADLREKLLVQSEMNEQAEDAGRRLADLEQERDALEIELEKVRTRAADVQEQAESRERKMEQQRDEMNDELRQLRKLVEQSAALSGPMTSPARMTKSSRATDERHGNSPASDPVVDSVMAQFAKLQKDVSARRKRPRG